MGDKLRCSLPFVNAPAVWLHQNPASLLVHLQLGQREFLSRNQFSFGNEKKSN